MTVTNPPRRPRLRRLRIESFRGIDTLDLDLTGAGGEALDLVVLGGDNGCGKTAVLEAALLLLGKQRLLQSDAAPLGAQVRFGASDFRIEGEMETEPARCYVPGAPVGSELEYGPKTFSLSANRSVLEHPTTQATFYDTGVVEVPNGPFWEALQKLSPEVEYFSARRAPEALGQAVDTKSDPLQAEAARIRELKRRLVSAYYRALRSRQTELPQFTHLQNMWEHFNGPGAKIDVFPVDNNPASGDEVVLREDRAIPADVTSLAMATALAPARPDIPRMVPIDRLSSGEVALLAFAGPLIFRDRQVDIVVIDEPEQHLHVQWQRRLVEGLRMLVPHAQLVLATHSEEILSSVLSYERFILVRSNDSRANVDGEGTLQT